MASGGGLKLAIHGETRRDRRVRFAEVTVAPEHGAEVRLVTDAEGRLRYRLPRGEYDIRTASGGEAHCTVRSHGWSNIHLTLP